jgi:hypothetical protein
MTAETALRTLVWLALGVFCGLFWSILIYLLTGSSPFSSCAGASGFMAALAFGAWLCRGVES